MKKFFASKKFLFLISALALIATGLFIYFYYFSSGKNTISQILEGGLSPEIKSDKIPPFAVILSPADGSWHGFDFEVQIEDSEVGSGLVSYAKGEKGCKYIIEDLGNGASVNSFRECGSTKITVPVGKDKICSSSYDKDNNSQGKCMVSVKAYDKAGNESGWRGFVFNIDIVHPEVGEIAVSGGKNIFDLNKSYIVEATASDNSRITGCWLYVDGRLQNEKIDIDPFPCKDEKVCGVSTSISFDKEGEYNLKFGCGDAAGNLGSGKEIKIKTVTNHSPEISFCKVTPSQGSLQTEFKFQAESSDPDGDGVSYLWEFGDNQTSTEKAPSHYYLQEGTYQPRIFVSDGFGGEKKCQTAWVIVGD
ncbi:MAG: PKD domain-containing protein [Candidatus Paceibacterota bacterium]